MAKRSTALAEQIAIAAIGKAIPSRTSKNAEDSIGEGDAKRVRATVEIDGTISRSNGSEAAASASASPLQDALLAVLVKGLDPRTLAAKRRAAMSIVNKSQDAGMAVSKYLAKSEPEHTALINDLKAVAARELPAVTKRGSLRFVGDYEVSNIKVSAA